MSIRLKLVVMFLAVALIPVLFISLLMFHNYKKSMENTRLAELRNLADLKAERIEGYFEQLKTNIAISQSLYNFKLNLPVLTRLAAHPLNKEYIAAKEMLDEQIRMEQKVLGLSSILLIDKRGRVAYSSEPSRASKDVLQLNKIDLQKAFEGGTKDIYFSNVFINKGEENKFEMLVSAPLKDFDGRFIGVVAFEVDLTPFYVLVQDVKGLGSTGETLVGKKEGEDIVFLNPLRHDPSAALKRHVHLHEKDSIGIQNAVLKQEGSGAFIDYRRKEVIGAWKYIPLLNWGVVAKIDASEAFAEISNLRNLVVIITLIVLLLSGVMAMSIAESIAEPIKKLSKGAEIVGSGNLDHLVGTNLQDEIGQLSRSFDKMTSDLKKTTASRDELDKEVRARKRSELELRRSNENLEQFAYVASHDLQEPLRMMASYSALLEKRYKDKLDPDANEFIGYIVDGAKRMQKLINDILTYSRIGKGDTSSQEIDTNLIIAKVKEIIAPRIEESKAVITNDSLPVVMGSESNFIQLFQNLIGNAIKFHGPELPRVHVSAVRQGEEWVYSVKDNGIGIEPQYRDRIFRIFQRLHGREKYPGTGIGLSICKKIVESAGGRIWVESEENKGATFFFTIPVKNS